MITVGAKILKKVFFFLNESRISLGMKFAKFWHVHIV